MPEEIKQEVVLKTQKYLGKYVKKPPLSEKLLRKPPFRFLHDIINTVIRETGFLKGLFSEEELNSENVKEREAKVAFLSKLIDAVKTITDTDLAVRPSKIVAGLEPAETNFLLQTIGKAIEKKIDSSNYVNQLNSGQIINADKNKKSKKVTDKNEKVKKSSKSVASNEEKKDKPPKIKEKQSSSETPKSTDQDKSKTRRPSKESKNKNATEDKPKTKDKPKKKEKSKEKSKESPKDSTQPSRQETQKNLVPNSDIIKESNEKESINDAVENFVPDVNTNRSIPDEESKVITEPLTVQPSEAPKSTTEPRKRSTSASRPKSARPRSGDPKERQPQEEKEPIQIQSRPKSSLRPPSVRPSSARPGAPRLRPDSGLPIKEVVPMGKINVIVENFDKDIDEEETVIIQSNPETVEEHAEHVADVPVDNKGHLVEQILEQINESDATKGSAVKSEEDWQKDVFQGKNTTTKETNNLKSFIQSLTKTANPLGKLLNYLHEDIDAMQVELESWTNTKRQLFDEIDKQKKISMEMNKPLISQLEHLSQEIKKIEDEIVNTRSNILRNDVKIKELLSK